MTWIWHLIPAIKVFYDHEGDVTANKKWHMRQQKRNGSQPTWSSTCSWSGRTLQPHSDIRARSLAIKASGVVTRCARVEVIPRSHKNYTEEISTLHNRTEINVDPISYIIKLAGLPVHCNDVTPPRYKLGWKWSGCLPPSGGCYSSWRSPSWTELTGLWWESGVHAESRSLSGQDIGVTQWPNK